MRVTPPVPRPPEEPWSRANALQPTLPMRPDVTHPARPQHLARPVNQDATPVARRSHPRLAWARRHAPFAVVLLLAAYFLTINISTPWQSMHEDNGTLNESIALNHIRYGLTITKGTDLLDLEAKQSFGPANVSEADHFNFFLHGPTHPAVYGDHPPLLGLTITGSFLLFGPHFWSERLVPIVYSLVDLILFYALMCQLFDVGVARIAAFLFATFPLLGYFGRNVSHEPAVLCWALVLLLAYIRWRGPTPNPSKGWRGELLTDQSALIRTSAATSRHLPLSMRSKERGPGGGAVPLMVIATVIGGLYGWPLFYFAAILFVVDWYAQRRFNRTLFLATIMPAAITFVLVLAQIAWALNGDLAGLGAMFLHRTGGGGEQAAVVTGIGWFSQVTTWNAEDFGAWSQVAMPLVVAFIAMRASREQWSLRIQMIVVLALWGISHVMIFRNGAYVHAYWQFYLLPVYALGISWAVVSWTRTQIPARNLRALVLICACFAVANLNLATTLALYSTGFHVTLPVVPLFDLWR